MTLVTHPHLRSGWTAPAIPSGFDALVCCDFGDGFPTLDFVSNVRCDFASETQDVTIEWPWSDGFRPGDSDWQAIGVEVINFR